MSGGKGSSSTPITTTAQQTNPLAKYVQGAADYLTPYAQDPTRPFTAPPNPYQTAGYQGLADTGANVGGWPMVKAYDAYGNLITGGGTSPAAAGYAQFSAGQAGPQQTSDRVVNNAVNAAYGYADPITGYANQATAGNVGQDQLAAVAQGKYTDANSNPYLRDMVNAALRPVSENYQTSTAPTLDARFSAGGRYGSGAADVAANTARDAFARNLGEISTGMYGNEYRFERGQQDTAAAAYDAARRAGLGLGITGLTAAGNLVDQGERTALSAADLNQRGQTAGLAGLDTGFGRQLTTEQNALQNYPQFIQSLFTPARADIEAGTGLRGLEQSQLSEPYDKVRAYLQAISGGGSPGSSSASTTPYYTNDIASGLSAASGVLGLGKQLGIGSLFGGGGGAGASLAGLGADYGGGAAALGIPDVIGTAAADYAVPAAGKGAADALGLGAIFSDRRLKEDDRVIGNIGTLPLHSFRYKGDPATRYGFMADEVEKVDPGAVVYTASGYKAVDYLRAARAAVM